MHARNLKIALTPTLREKIPKGDTHTSSVLVPIGWNSKTKREEILLTKRTLLVETHKGHVSFPGGFCAEKDENVLQTALRETWEEIGVKAEDIEVAGPLATVETRGEIKIFPWVGLLNFPYPFSPNPGEVENLLYLDVLDLIEKGLSSVEIPMGASTIISQGIYVQDELVWGATARILQELREILIHL